MAIKSFVSVAQGVEQHLKSVYQQPQRTATRKSRSGTEILTDLYSKMDSLIAEIDVSSDSAAKKAAGYGAVARILQQLQAIEANAAVHIDKKALADMTPAELEQLTREALRLKGVGGSRPGILGIPAKNNVDSPSQDGSRAVNTASLTQNKKTEGSFEVSRETYHCDLEAAPKNKKQQQRALASAEARRRKAAKTHLPKHSENTPNEELDPEDVDAMLDEIVRGL